MSTLGSESGAFNNELQEDDDDLRVPCDLSASISTSSSLDEISPVFKKAPTVSVSSTSASLVTKDRKFSDFLQFMDEEVLSEMTSVVPMTSTSMTSLDSDWLNKAFQAEDFAGLLASSSSFSAPASLMDFEVSSSPSSPMSTLHDVTAVDFESLIDLSLELDSAPVVASEPVFASPAPISSKKRGRPSSKTEAASPAPAKKQRSSEPATPATPKPHPLSKPQNDDPEELERYTKYRASNNVAACQSRLRRKERERENADRVTILEAQNAELKKELASLQGECGKLKSLLENFLAEQQKKRV